MPSSQLALATGEEHLGDPGGGKNADVPGTPVGDVGQLLEAEPGEAHLDGGEAEHILGMRSGETQDRRPADVLAGEVHWSNVEPFDQKVQVLGGGLAVVGA